MRARALRSPCRRAPVTRSLSRHSQHLLQCTLYAAGAVSDGLGDPLRSDVRRDPRLALPFDWCFLFMLLAPGFPGNNCHRQDCKCLEGVLAVHGRDRAAAPRASASWTTCNGQATARCCREPEHRCDTCPEHGTENIALHAATRGPPCCELCFKQCLTRFKGPARHARQDVPGRRVLGPSPAALECTTVRTARVRPCLLSLATPCQLALAVLRRRSCRHTRRGCPTAA